MAWLITLLIAIWLFVLIFKFAVANFWLFILYLVLIWVIYSVVKFVLDNFQVISLIFVSAFVSVLLAELVVLVLSEFLSFLGDYFRF